MQQVPTQENEDLEGTLSALDFKEYEVLYTRWKKNMLTNKDVIAIGGKHLLDLMETQFVLDTETQGWGVAENHVTMHKKKYDDLS